MTAFDPAADGFPFVNSWPSEPAVSIATPFGPVNIGNAQAGLCGGMVFAALDCWYAHVPGPPHQPAAGAPFYNYLVERLVDSWNLPVGVAQYFTWMHLPDGDSSFNFLGQPVTIENGVFSRTVSQQWPQVRADIDAGRPSPLGIVTVQSTRLSDLALNHQVLAHTYTCDGTVVSLQVYDPNLGQHDDIAIHFDTGQASPSPHFTHNLGIDEPVRGFFRASYSPTIPPSS